MSECVIVRDPWDERGRDLDHLLHLYPCTDHYIPVSELEREQYPTRRP